MSDDEGHACVPQPSGEETRWLSDDEQQTWLAVITLLLQLPGALETQLQRDSGLTLFEYLVLSSLSMTEDRTLRMSVLAEQANSSLSRLSNVVSRFERRGWVERAPDPCDARYTVVHLRDAGYAQVVAAAPGHVAAVRRYVVDPLTAAQQRAITGAVARIRPGLMPRKGDPDVPRRC